MFLVIETDQIENFVKEISGKHCVVDVTQTNSLLPPAKKHIYPATEELFKIGANKKKLIEIDNSKHLIIFGLNPADLRAMTQLDEIMLKSTPDFFYFQRRDKAILVGLSEFSLEVNPEGDIVLEKINDHQYQVLILSAKGKKIKSKLFKKVNNPKIVKYPFKKTPLDEMILDPELLKNVVEWSHDHKIWDELDKQCLGCGNCTYVCPLCYCFSVEDRISVKDGICTRCRLWDACTLPNFARVAGDHDFHKGIKMRYYNWFYHKFVRGYKEYGKSLCVACHRCQETCPAGIDIEKVLLKLINDYTNR